MAMMAGGPAVEENKGELSVRMMSGFSEDVEPPPQSVADVERSQHKATWHEAMKIALDSHKNDWYVRSRDTAARAETCRCKVGVFLKD